MATITGTTFNDVITEDDLIGAITGGIPSLLPDLIEAHGGNDVVDASGGNDTLYGGAGDDTLLGGEGNDILDSTTTTGAGNDLLMGGAGNDTLFAYGNDTIDGGEGDDLIRVWRDQAYTLQGGSGIDTVSISDSFWSIGATFSLEQNGIEIIDGMGREIRGDSVNNVINFSGVTLNRVKFIDLQEGEDTLIGSTGSIDVRGGQGNDSVTGSIDNDFLYGGTEDDTLIGGDGNDVLDADFYADGNDSLLGGNGNDSIFAFQSDTIDGGEDNDLILVSNDQSYSIQGGSGLDTISFTKSSWLIGDSFSLAANGIEIIQGNGGEILGGTVNNALDLSGISLINVQAINLQEGDDTLSGLDAATTVRGGSGNDSVSGSIGDDVLSGGVGDDTLLGGDGNDILDRDPSFGSGSDPLFSGNDLLFGGGGNDMIFAFQNDTIDGGMGDDLIHVFNDQAYSIQGGEGTDTVSIRGESWIIGTRFSLAANGIEIVLGYGGRILGGDVNNALDFSGVSLNQIQFLDLQAGNDTVSSLSSALEVRGSQGNDLITGSSGDDTLIGGSDNDTLVGGAGNDVFESNTLNGSVMDSIGGGLGNDSILGGMGNDTIFAYQNDTIDGGDGNDLIRVWDDRSYTLQGGAGTDTVAIASTFWNIGPSFNLAANGIEVIEGNGKEIYGGIVNNSLNFSGITLNRVPFLDLQEGNDTVTGFGQAMEVRGSQGNDSITGSSGNDTLLGGRDNDTLLGGDGNDRLDNEDYGIGNDFLVGGGGNDIIFALGNDTIDGGAGDDLIRVWNDSAYTFQGGTGTDTITIASSRWIISPSFSLAANGIEIIEGNGEEIFGGSLSNSLNFSGIRLNRVLYIDLEDGDDTLSGLGEATDVRGGRGNDSIQGSASNDTLQGGLNNDTLLGGEGNDILDNESSGTGNDSLAGGGGDDTIFANQNDSIDGGEGNDVIWVSNDSSYTLQGGAGTDSILILNSYWVISTTFSLAANGIEIIDGNGKGIYGESINNIVDLSGIALNNVPFVDLQEGNDSVIGSSSADDLRGGTGDDTLIGGMGDDTLRGNVGADSYDGGAGSDTLDFSFTAAGGTIALPAGVTSMGGATETFTSIENVIGSNGNDTIIGSNEANRLEGGGLNDRIEGGLGNDTLSGGFGFDALDGGDGLDTIDFSYLPSSAQVVINLQLTSANTTGTEVSSESILSFENAIGGLGNDTIIGTSAANRLEGSEGNDSLVGNAGSDTLIGGFGADTINGGDDTDTVDYRYTNGSPLGATIIGGAVNLLAGTATMGGTDQDTLIGIEWVIGSEGRDSIIGSDLANQLDGQRSNDSISGGLGNDTLIGGLGNDTLDGGGDHDSLLGGNGSDLINGGAGNDTLDGNANADSLTGGIGDDIYIFDGSPDVFIELAAEGLDRVLASATYALGNGDNIEDLTLTGDGATSASGNELNNLLTGNAAANGLSGFAGNDTLLGGGGNDTLEGGDGNDSLNGGVGVDTASYASAANAVRVRLTTAAAQNTGGAGTDALTAIENLLGSAFADTLTGSSGHNSLSGGEGNDTLDGGAGNDSLNGGGGVDTATYASATAAVTVSLATAAAQNTGGAGTDTLTAIENLVGSAFTDRLTGSDGNNVLSGGQASDTLEGAAGNDTLDGGLGDDSVNGGMGVDTATYASATAAVTVSLATAVAQNTGGAGTDTLTAIENLTGSAFADLLIGGADNNVLSGGQGNDTLEAGAGNDTLDGGAGVDTATYTSATAAVTVSLATAAAQNTGGAGTDTLTAIENLIGSAFADLLTGSSANNSLSGGQGNDTLQGGNGADTLIGGEGADSLVGGLGADAFKLLAPTDGVDTITAFLPGTDRIEVVSSTFASLPLGSLAPSQLIFGAPSTPDPVFLYNTATGALSFDGDGTGLGVAQQLATLSGLPALTASGIVVVGA